MVVYVLDLGTFYFVHLCPFIARSGLLAEL